MNQTDQQLAALIEDARRTGVDIVTFIQQQAPQLADEIVRREIAVSATFGGLALAVFLGLLLLAAVRWRSDDWESDAGALLVFSLLPLAIALVNLYHLINALTAPRVLVLEHLAQLASRIS